MSYLPQKRTRSLFWSLILSLILIIAILAAPVQTAVVAIERDPSELVLDTATTQPLPQASAEEKSNLADQLPEIERLAASGRCATDEVIIRVDSPEAAATAAAGYGATIKRFSEYGFAVLRLDDDQTLLETIELGTELSNPLPAAYPNIRSHTSELTGYQPNDPSFAEQYFHETIHTPLAWLEQKGTASTVIAVIDTGIDLDHPDRPKNLSSYSYNAVTGSMGVNAHIQDDLGHGTLLAGILAAPQDNATGGSGIAPGATLMVIKANEAGQDFFYTDSLLDSIYHAVQYGADIINMSLGYDYAYGAYLPYWDAIRYADDRGVLLVAAAGNSGKGHADYPAAFPEVIAVSAQYNWGEITDFSNYGPEIDLAAPGYDVFSTALDNDYQYAAGTSFAAPIVAGVAALAKSADPSLTPARLKQLLYGMAEDLGATGWDNLYGHGQVSALAAVDFFAGSGTPADPYLISSANQLRLLANESNSDSPTLQTSTFKLTCDLDLSESGYWTPISQDPYGQPFSGTFDGDGHTIHGLQVQVVSETGEYKLAGLVGYLSGTVKNLTLTGVRVEMFGKGFANTGAVAGFSEGTIENCHVSGIVNGGKSTDSSYTGGIVGWSNDGTISGCSNSADVTDAVAGGIAGSSDNGLLTTCDNTGTVTGELRAGGISGENYANQIVACTNVGAVISATEAGGIAAINYDTISQCINAGTVTAGNGASSSAGGLAGKNASGFVTNSFNIASVTGGIQAGGLVGRQENGSLAECYNVGLAKGLTFSGGVTGYDLNGTYTHTYFLNTNAKGVGNSLSISGVLAKSQTQMKDSNSYTGFDFVNTWTLAPSYPYPGLKSLDVDWKTVTFDSNGGTTEIIPSQIVRIGEGTLVLPTIPPTRPGYTFLGWNLQADGNGPALTSQTLVTDDLTVYAWWLQTPVQVTAQSETAKSIRLSWDTVSGDSITYQVYRATTAGGTYTLAATTPETSALVSGLTPGATYYFKVRARKTVGSTAFDSADSSIVSAKPLPAKPVLDELVPASATSIRLVWSKVPDVAGYKIYRSTVSGQGPWTLVSTVSATLSSYTNTALITGQRYYYAVKSYYGSFLSDYSNALDQVTYPDAPSYLELGGSLETGITLAWGGSPGVTGYEIERRTIAPGETDFALIGKTTTATTFKDATVAPAGTHYAYRVRAYKTVSTLVSYASDWTQTAETSNLLTAAASQYAVTIENPDYQSLQLTWSAIDNATDYLVYRAASLAGPYVQIASTSETSYLDTGLATGKIACYKIKAVRTVPATPQVQYAADGSLVASGKPLPAPPTHVQAESAAYNAIRLTWDAADGATGYRIYRATTPTGTYALVGSSTSLSYISTGLVMGQSYYFKIRSYRIASGLTSTGLVDSNVATAWPILGSVTSLTAQAASTTSIKLSWLPVAGATKYTIFQTNADNSVKGPSVAVTTTTYTWTGLTPGSPCYFVVLAERLYNGQTYTSLSDSPIATSIPGPVPPTGLTARSLSSDQVLLTWNPSGDANIHYEIYRSTDGRFSLAGEAYTATFTDSGLETGTPYTYKIKACTSTLTGADFSSTVTVTPLPATVTGLWSYPLTYDSVWLYWTEVPGATSYEIYQATTAAGVYTQIATATENTATIASLTCGKTYYYKVKAVTAGFASPSFSTAVAAKPLPAPPASLKAASASATSVRLSWDEADGATGYKIYRSTAPYSGFTQIATTTNRYYTAIGLIPWKTYYFRIISYRIAGGVNTSGTIPSQTLSAFARPQSPDFAASMPESAYGGYYARYGFSLTNRTGKTIRIMSAGATLENDGYYPVPLTLTTTIAGTTNIAYIDIPAYTTKSVYFKVSSGYNVYYDNFTSFHYKASFDSVNYRFWSSYHYGQGYSYLN